MNLLYLLHNPLMLYKTCVMRVFFFISYYSEHVWEAFDCFLLLNDVGVMSECNFMKLMINKIAFT